MRIPLEAVHAWLNVINPTHLSLVSGEMLAALRAESLSKKNVDQLIKEVIDYSQKSADSLEYAEVLTHCAVVRAARGEYKYALSHMQTAVDLYQGSYSKYAVVLWMLGWIEWQLLENRKAYAYWTDARDDFKSQVVRLIATHRMNYFEQIPWFLERIEDMNRELALQPEELYSWINLFDGSHLNETALRFRDLLDRNIAENKNASVYQIMQDMQNVLLNTPDYQTIPEVLVEAGLAAYQLGIKSEAETLLKRAVGLFHPESHQQASALWMLGAVQLRMEKKISEAFRNWGRSIEIFESIPNRLKSRDRESYLEWEQSILPILKRVLEDAILEYV